MRIKGINHSGHDRESFENLLPDEPPLRLEERPTSFGFIEWCLIGAILIFGAACFGAGTILERMQ